MTKRLASAIAPILFSLLAIFAPHAEAQELLVWQASPGAAKVILPILPGETERAAVDAYFKAMQSNAEMAKAFRNCQRVDTSKSVFTKLGSVGSRARSVIQANTANDIDPGGFRMGEILKVAREQKGEAFVLPPAAALRLNEAQQYKFQDKIYDAFDLRINIGGDDVHPSLYGQDITHARKDELNLTRDKYELALMVHWQMRNAKAVREGRDGKPEFGICRGHQLMATSTRYEQKPGSLETRAVEGHTMIQDNVHDGASKDGTHLDRLMDPSLRSVQHWHHVYVKDSLFADMIGRRGNVLVNDWHHQSVRANPKARTRVVAIAPDGIVEALESPDRLTLSVQFHPEFTSAQSGDVKFTRMGHKLIGGIFSLAISQRSLRECSAVFKVGAR